MKFKGLNLAGLFTAALVAFGVGLSVERAASAEQKVNALPLDELRVFSEIFQEIEDYVEPVEDKELLTYAIQGMVNRLDPHSDYLLPDAHSDLQASTSGQFGGLGIEVTMEDGFIKVISPIDDTPAQRAGIQPGDLVIRLDDLAIKGMTLRDAVKRMRGRPGTKITLTIVREGEDRPREIEIVRDIIKVRSVRGRILEPGFGYIRISQFQERTGASLEEMARKLEEENGAPLRGLVLDLRNNPGGMLNAAVEVADAFLEEGLVVYTQGRTETERVRFRAEEGDLLEGAPLVALVNGGSASASEIVAGALQDHKRGLIIGARTFGKGSVQTVIPMRGGAALKLTTALYYTPAGRSIQAEGIAPDIRIGDLKVSRDPETSPRERFSESSLAGHLVNDAPAATETPPQEGAEDDEKSGAPQEEGAPNDAEAPQRESANPARDADEASDDLAKQDFMLFEALNILKGLSFLLAAP